MGRTTQIVSMLKLQMLAKIYWFCELVYYISPNFILYKATSTLTTCLWGPTTAPFPTVPAPPYHWAEM